ncbi:ABC transporter ATP-binding protein [Fusobacterium russii]|uniref:ABC transporter ATP-binding protein n=1 Tax=Fusobacterium russii TaxID=854 RepID=UPI0003AA872E|nr:ATP-binding cassette domain-containing protein [Fusobacterium russii]
MNFIELKNINKTFHSETDEAYHALKNINLTIKSGDFITIVGGNGAGKSTLLNAIAGTLTIDSGSIIINNKDITKTKEYERAAFISRVFQNPLDGTAPRMTVAENMSLALRRGKKRNLSSGIKKEELQFFEENLKSLNLGLENRLNTEIGLLSGGQRQAISLLMATMKNPELVLLDEHTAALDPKTQKNIMKLTEKKIKEKKLTAFMITHNLQDALEYGNRLIVMHYGEIVKDISNDEKKSMTIQKLYEILSELE